MVEDAKQKMSQWRSEASVFRKRGYEGEAQRAEDFADELAELIRQFYGRMCLVEEAAERHGYTVAGIGRMIKDGVVRAECRPDGVYVYVAELPVKPGYLLRALGGHPDDVAGTDPVEVQQARLRYRKEQATASTKPRTRRNAARQSAEPRP